MTLIVFYRDMEWREEDRHEVDCMVCLKNFYLGALCAHICGDEDPDDPVGEVCEECVDLGPEQIRSGFLLGASRTHAIAAVLGPEHSRDRVGSLRHATRFAPGCYCKEDLENLARDLEHKATEPVRIDRAVRVYCPPGLEA